MAESVLIRKYIPSDLEDGRSLWVELTDWHRQIYQDPSIGGANPESFFDAHLLDVGGDCLWVASCDQHVVGLAGLIVKDKEAEIEPLIVSQPYRNKGIGTRLVETIIVEARKMGIRFLSVRPVARNVDAIEFFYDRGFMNMGHVELFIDFSNRRWKKGLMLFNHQFNY